MSILLDKRELKKAAKELTLVKLTDVIETLNAVLAERQVEVELGDLFPVSPGRVPISTKWDPPIPTLHFAAGA